MRAAVLVALVALAGCAGEPSSSVSSPESPGSSAALEDSPTSPVPVVVPAMERVPNLVTAGRPDSAVLSIPALDLRGVRVVPYAGTPDDRPGTAIQDAGDLAAPHGAGGLVGPGGLGNFLVTGHRTSSTRPFAALPGLRPGARVVVETRTHRLVYEITRTRWTSFRRPSSLRAQSSAVPGHPGRAPTRAMITLSTCATAEDHAAGNHWADEFHNPEHRIDKIGVLRSLRRL